MTMVGNAILRYSDDKIYNYIEKLLKRSMKRSKKYLYSTYEIFNKKPSIVKESKKKETYNSIDYINIINYVFTLTRNQKIKFDNIDNFILYLNNLLEYSKIVFVKNSLNFNKPLYYINIKFVESTNIAISAYNIQEEIFIIIPDNFLGLLYMDKNNDLFKYIINLIVKLRIKIFKDDIKKEKEIINELIVDIENFRLKYNMRKEDILQIFNKFYFQKGLKTSKVKIDLIIKYISDVLFKFYQDYGAVFKWKRVILHLYDTYAMFFFFDKKIELISESNAVEIIKTSNKKYVDDIKYRKLDIEFNKEKKEILINGIVTPFYTIKVLFRNIDIDDLIKNIKNLNYLKSKILSSDILVDCSCPDFTFGGYKYIATIKKYALEKETRKPKVRNPKLEGSVCKHLHKLLYDIINNQKYILFIQNKLEEYASTEQ